MKAIYNCLMASPEVKYIRGIKYCTFAKKITFMGASKVIKRNIGKYNNMITKKKYILENINFMLSQMDKTYNLMLDFAKDT